MQFRYVAGVFVLEARTRAIEFYRLNAISRSTSPSRPNNFREGNARPSVGMSVRPYVRPQSFLDFNEIWYVDRGR